MRFQKKISQLLFESAPCYIHQNMTTADSKISPMMLQWQQCKEEAASAILFFRLGDFYEAFHEDAKLLARELDLTLTQRQQTPMSGIPVHAAESYIDKLLERGYKVAIAEQIEDPKLTKGLVKREIVRILTPGTSLSSSLLLDKSNHFIAALSQLGQLFGLALFDLSTSDLRVIELDSLAEAQNELCKFTPKELIIPAKLEKKYAPQLDELKKTFNCRIDQLEDWRFEHELTYGTLIQTFKVHSLDGFGLKGMVAAINSAGALLSYVQDSLKHTLGPIRAIQPYSNKSYMAIDRTTLRHLELVESSSGSKKHTLLASIDYTETAMGGRELKRWILQPLQDLDEIHGRQEAIEALVDQEASLSPLKEIRDLERLITKITSKHCSPKDLLALKNSLPAIEEVYARLDQKDSSLLAKIKLELTPYPALYEILNRALSEDPPYKLNDGGAIKSGFNSELDELRQLASNSKDWMERYQESIRESTGIRTLRVGFTRLSGFYIEVSKGQAEKVPDLFQRRQTLTNAERFITPELKVYEDKILHAEDKALEIERALFQTLCEEVSSFSENIMQSARAIATLDALASLMVAAKENRYTKPIVDRSSHLEISQGRHPIIEKTHLEEPFTPNDTLLNGETETLMLITGPNMSGKSTYIRQTALCTILAHMGSFVPASYARIGLIDKVFARIGANDDLARGQSTFMVEMTETAAILRNTTARSLIILDEIGRGTSTYDGISLAWSIAEYLLTEPEKRAKTLFATHYFELTKLEERIQGAVNYNVAVHEADGEVHFLRKIVKGYADKSYGIHVGRLAGLPASVLDRAEEILLHLEENADQKKTFAPQKRKRITNSKPLAIKDEQIYLNF